MPRPTTATVHPTLWRRYLVVGALITVPYFVLPRASSLQSLVTFVVGLSGGVATIVGVRLHRPQYRLPWFLLIAGEITYGLAFLVSSLTGSLSSRPRSLTVSDGMFLLAYLLFALALAAFVHRRKGLNDRASVIDAAIISLGLAVPSWVFLVSPFARTSDLSAGERVVSVAYPLMDVLMLSMLVLLLVAASGRRTVSLRALTAGIVVQLVSDSFYLFLLLNGSFHRGGPIDAGWFFLFVLFGTAALHPSMADLTTPEPRRQDLRSRGRVLALALAALLAPAFVLLEEARGRHGDTPILAILSILLFFLVLIRLRTLMVDVDQHERTERALRQSEAKYRALVEELPAIVYTAELGQEGMWRYISPKLEAILGFTPEEWMANPRLWYEQVYEEDRDGVMAAEEQIRTRGRLSNEYRMRTRDGRVVWIRDEGAMLKDAEGGFLVQGVMVDITRLKNAEADLRSSEARLRALVASLDDIVFEFDDQGRYLNVWTTYEPLLAMPKRDILGRSIATS